MICKIYRLNELQQYKYVVVLSVYKGKIMLSRHKARTTWETQGGHIEPGETPLEAAKRELYEETGALEFDIEPICIYSVTAPDNLNHGEESFGMLFFADIRRFEAELHSEIDKIVITDRFPERWTYPDIQPHLIEEAKKRGYL